MLLLGSITAAFYTQFKTDPWLQMGARAFFSATGVSGLLFTTRLAGTWWLPISPSPALSPRRRWTLAMLIPVDVLTMGFGCGGCHLACLSLLMGASMMAGLAVHEVRRGVSASLLPSLSLLDAIPHGLCAHVINRRWIEPLGASPHGYAVALVGIGCAVLGLRGVWPRLALVLAAIPGGAAVTFGIGHHVLAYPWERHEGRRAAAGHRCPTSSSPLLLRAASMIMIDTDVSDTWCQSAFMNMSGRHPMNVLSTP
jgi:hypothetical protein